MNSTPGHQRQHDGLECGRRKRPPAARPKAHAADAPSHGHNSGSVVVLANGTGTFMPIAFLDVNKAYDPVAYLYAIMLMHVQGRHPHA